MLYIVDYLDVDSDEILAIFVEAESDDEAFESAKKELKDLSIPKRNIINIEVI